MKPVLAILGFTFLGYSSFELADAWWFQTQQNQALLAPLPSPLVIAPPTLVPDHGLLGRLVVDRIHLSVMVMEGTTPTTLRRAAGHIAGTALPGQPGNIGIAAHRDTFFLPLQHIQANDVISLTTLAGEFRYRVTTVTIVGPADADVLSANTGEFLTLVTCYPFTFIGSAPERFIVRAERFF
jgi:sortase A